MCKKEQKQRESRMRKISILSVVAALVVATCGESMAASSLVTSANSANTGAISRASSLRLNSMGRAASLNTRQKAVKTLGAKASVNKQDDSLKTRSASVSRNSIGKYIGATQEHSVSMAALPDPLFDRIGAIENNVQSLENDVQNLNETKQDKVTTAQQGNIAVWDDAGQTSDSSKSITQDAVSDTSTHDTIPTSKAVYDYVSAQNYVDSDTLTQTLTDYVTTDAIADAVNDAAQTVVNGLAPVATSGAYSDLTGTPTDVSTFTNDANYITAADVPDAQAQADWEEADSTAPSFIRNKPNLATVATSGQYGDLTGTPTNVSTFTNDANYITAINVPDAQEQANWNETDSTEPSFIRNKPSLATVATSGNYSDLQGAPTLGSAAFKDVATEIISGNEDLATAGQVFGAVDTLRQGAEAVFYQKQTWVDATLGIQSANANAVQSAYTGAPYISSTQTLTEADRTLAAKIQELNNRISTLIQANGLHED